VLYERPTLVVVQVGGLGGPAKKKAGFTRSAARDFSSFLRVLRHAG
jgi:hypothetical protein